MANATTVVADTATTTLSRASAASVRASRLTTAEL